MKTRSSIGTRDRRHALSSTRPRRPGPPSSWTPGRCPRPGALAEVEHTTREAAAGQRVTAGSTSWATRLIPGGGRSRRQEDEPNRTSSQASSGLPRPGRRRAGPTPSLGRPPEARRCPGGQRERDLSRPAEPVGARLERDEARILDVTEIPLQAGNLVAQRQVPGAKLVGAIRRGRRFSDLAGEAEREERRREHAGRGDDATPREAGHREAGRVETGSSPGVGPVGGDGPWDVRRDRRLRDRREAGLGSAGPRAPLRRNAGTVSSSRGSGGIVGREWLRDSERVNPQVDVVREPVVGDVRCDSRGGTPGLDAGARLLAIERMF